MSDHLTPKQSNRGFAHLPAIPGAYGGEAKVYESSAASGPHLWLCVTEPTEANKPGGPFVEATLHLTVENAAKLAEQIQYLIANHYQGVEW